jgi:hypothetical protein
MPRVHTQIKNRRGRTVTCTSCRREIQPGEKYYKWSFRYGGTYTSCAEHPPRQSQLTQSKMSDVYAAIENAEDGLPNCESVVEVVGLIEEVASAVRDVAEEYREAAEPFGGAGENAERADELEGFADELESFSPDEEDEEADQIEEAKDKIREEMKADGFTEDDEAEWTSVFEARWQEWLDEQGDDAPEEGQALEAAREEAQELLNGCPL